ncbi:MAG: HlyD family efflux transporter periplasmic adaptor subunit [Clostridia bacterium]|nr:HlyD family efflux transporter periplasmic adaptor subunit [Clostridia bacterium]
MRKQKSRGGRVIAGVLAAALVLGGGVGGALIWRSAGRGPVKVFAVSDCAMTDDYFGGGSETYGEVRVEGLQKILLSETQTVTEIFVKEGQKVKKGDKIFAFDTTLSDLDISKAEINVTRLETQRQSAERELKTIRGMKPYTPPEPTEPSEPTEPVYISQQTPKLLSGEGTEESPYLVLWDADDVVDASVIEKLLSAVDDETDALSDEEPDDPESEAEEDLQEDPGTEPEEDPQEDPGAEPEDEPQEDIQEAWAVLTVREQNAPEAPLVAAWGLRIFRDGEEISFCFFMPDLPDGDGEYDEPYEPGEELPGAGGYSAAELAKMRAEKEKEIRELDVSIRIAELEVRRLKKEAEEGFVRAEVDGIVKALRDPLEAYENGEPAAEISAGGGYCITGAMSEMELGTVRVGQTVQVTAYSGMGESETYEGRITEISAIPTDESGYYGEGNTNVSSYPFKVFVDESAVMSEGDWAQIVYTPASEDGGEPFYLQNMFILSEKGRSFVYVKGADGLLERRAVKTGGDLWGEYTRIRSGLGAEDRIAFPYGSDVFEGAKTKDAEIDELYDGVDFYY